MKYFLIAGEASGDQHAGKLMQSLALKDQEAEFQFLGGDKMSQQGDEPVIHIREMAFMGFTQLIRHLGKIRRNFKKARSAIKDFKPDVLILVDYPGFNLRIAKWAKEQGYKVYYYIAPKVWAWNTKRVYSLKENTDKVFSILPFEKDFFNAFKLDTIYAGNPVLEEINRQYPDATGKIREGIKKIALLPGSRKQEIDRVLPVMAEVVSRFKEYTFVIAGMGEHRDLYAKYISENSRLEISYKGTLYVLNDAAAALVTSGTATLEAALMGIPQIVCYKTNPLSYMIARRLIKVPYISLVNLILHRPAVPELIQANCSANNLADDLKMILPDGAKREDQLDISRKIREEIGAKQSSDYLSSLIISSLKLV